MVPEEPSQPEQFSRHQKRTTVPQRATSRDENKAVRPSSHYPTCSDAVAGCLLGVINGPQKTAGQDTD